MGPTSSCGTDRQTGATLQHTSTAPQAPEGGPRGGANHSLPWESLLLPSHLDGIADGLVVVRPSFREDLVKPLQIIDTEEEGSFVSNRSQINSKIGRRGWKERKNAEGGDMAPGVR